MPDLPGEPFSPPVAKKLIKAILADGALLFPRHAQEEMKKEKPPLLDADCLNVLHGGAIQPAELENGSWRYRVQTQKITVVIAFLSKTKLVLVTAWRNTQ